MFRGEVEVSHPRFPPGSKAACVPDFQPPSDAVFNRDSIVDIPYQAEDDRAIEKWIRKNVRTAWQCRGTAKMAPLREMGVVDKDLNVHGVTGLKVVDLSIVPKDVGAHTGNTAILIGEKGFDIIARELALGASVPTVKASWRCHVPMKEDAIRARCKACVYCDEHMDVYVTHWPMENIREETDTTGGFSVCTPCDQHSLSDATGSWDRGKRKRPTDEATANRVTGAGGVRTCLYDLANGTDCGYCQGPQTADTNSSRPEMSAEGKGPGGRADTENCTCQNGYNVCEYHNESGKIGGLEQTLKSFEQNIRTLEDAIAEQSLGAGELLAGKQRLREEVRRKERVQQAISRKNRALGRRQLRD